MSKKPKIPCFVMTYFEFDNFKKTIEELSKYEDQLDLKIVENKSKYTENKFAPYIKGLIKKGIVTEYFLFSENITNNAIKQSLWTLIFLKFKVNILC